MLKTTLDRDQFVRLFKLLSSDKRLSLLKLLERKKCCVCELTAALQMSQPAISQHLRKLRDCGVVTEERQGQWIYYALNAASPMNEMLNTILAEVPVCLDDVQRMEQTNQC
ncbi:ArsR/SmtB family transcription factor [Lentibacillus saliphilus]|uniref:ArsR/SmtB family transcription factor n=1 Tax=Lentibacillus saliphilus TaxID=2737028 RepID=UPI001C2F6CB8|nr:metalloregulator ArsR/SmtB family transcription factor [Lentibacillus saliphilus]